MSWMQTYSGKAVRLDEPHPDSILLEDIAWSLSGQQRYAAHCRESYSVAQHSVLIARYLYETTKDPLIAMAGLLHDGHEAYMGDLPTPVLAVLPLDTRQALKELKLRLDAAICASLCHKHQHALVGMMRSALVRDADTRILLDERMALHALPPIPWDIDEMGFEPLGVDIVAWDRVTAESEFVFEFQRLTDLMREPW